MAAVKFTQGDMNNVELVRQIVFHRLKDGQWNLLYDDWAEAQAGQYVTFETHHLRDQFIMLVLEVMWELIIQGVVTPGKDTSNPELPYFRITRHGTDVIKEDRFVPHDPTGYLSEVGKVATSDVGKAAIPYLEEALRCFAAGCNVSSVMMVGIGSEAVLLGLCKVVTNKISDPREAQEFGTLQWVKGKHRWLVDKYRALPKSDRKALPESLDTTLPSLYELIRRQRNDVGHPAEHPPSINRELAFVYLRLIPTLISDLEAFAAYVDGNGI